MRGYRLRQFGFAQSPSAESALALHPFEIGVDKFHPVIASLTALHRTERCELRFITGSKYDIDGGWNKSI